MTDFPGFGRGRGNVSFTPLQSFGRGRAGLLAAPVSSTPRPVFAELNDKPVDGDCDESHHSKSDTKSTKESLYAEIATQIGVSIGESIASCIESRLGCGLGNSLGSASNVLSEPSLLNVIVKSDVKEPVCFRGDGCDTCSVQEWEEMLMTYLKKKGVQTAEQADEVLSKLAGRAREIVRVGIRSKPSLSLKEGPKPIFEILKQHFSDTACSSMPLADFYATLPTLGETPFDYWLRLNRAMELTEDCLKRQNKSFAYLTKELTAMFIRHCPDSELSLIFKCKPLQQWTPADVHEKLLEHSKDQKCGPQLSAPSALSFQRQEVSPHVQQVTCSSTCATPSPTSTSVSSTGLNAPAPADRLDHVIALLEKVLEGQPRQAKPPAKEDVRAHRNQTHKVMPCVICGDTAHSTYYHCRANQLCFICYAADHTRARCPRAVPNKTRGPESAAHQLGN
ncbi:uncharacterized protein LOC122836928 [Gambusia affinis]|uniref:uncharacterized protein LOC122836928 n=1 Tax=Gambusia affinis TaxID=33528 RepID=UPI001CDCC606|nr:uncharacterized protein LOC122836928 [Gambusia affinis]XP_043982845.1 uncharacterized protein LOC122836928 [Gambusia affinis]XP_043982847.1 uncharacterized protein LOC122836928 [Gambusia affinis]